MSTQNKSPQLRHSLPIGTKGVILEEAVCALNTTDLFNFYHLQWLYGSKSFSVKSLYFIDASFKFQNMPPAPQKIKKKCLSSIKLSIIDSQIYIRSRMFTLFTRCLSSLVVFFFSLAGRCFLKCLNCSFAFICSGLQHIELRVTHFIKTSSQRLFVIHRQLVLKRFCCGKKLREVIDVFFNGSINCPFSIRQKS